MSHSSTCSSSDRVSVGGRYDVLDGVLIETVLLGHDVHDCSSSWLIGHRPAAVSPAQGKALPSARESAHGYSVFGLVGYSGVVRKINQMAHDDPISEVSRQQLRDHIARRQNRLFRTHSAVTDHHHMVGSTPEEGPRGIFHPRSVRPQPAITWRCGSAVTQDHILDAGLKSLVSRPLPLFLESPLAHRGIRLLPPEPLGALSRQPRH